MAPDTRSACRHAAGTCGHRREASGISPVCAASWRTARMRRRGPRGSPSGPPPSRAVRADPCRCWGTRGSTGTRAGVSPTRTPCRRIAMDNPLPCGYPARMRASARVRRRRARLSDHGPTSTPQPCAAMRRGAMGIYRVCAGSDGESHMEALRLEGCDRSIPNSMVG